MNTQSEQSVTLTVPFPFGEEQVFRYRALEDIVEVLVRNPFRSFTVSQLRNLTDSGSKTTTNAVALLEQLDLVDIEKTGRSKQVSLARNRVSIPDDPLFAIPQDEFRPPVRTFLDRVPEAIPSFAGLVLFGSVARGEADRRSDIDLWVLVEETDSLLQARRAATDLAADLSERRFHSGASERDRGDRYAFEVLVESVETAESHDEELVDILTTGIVLEDSEALQRVKDAVLDGQQEARSDV
jgi:predicted nucleotidyltransferase